MKKIWWGRCCDTYFEALDISREMSHDNLNVKGVEDCREHDSHWVVYAEKRAWHRGFKPDHIKEA